MKRRLHFTLIITFLISMFGISLEAAELSSTANSAIDKNNEMMLVFVERLKNGNVKEARKIAQDMANYSKNYKDNPTIEYKSFYSPIEKELYMLKNKNLNKKVVWVEEPISDGYYFLAVLDFQDSNYKEAIDNIQKCIYWNPVHAPYYIERGFIFLNGGAYADITSAQVAYEQALEFANNEDDFASALRGLGFVLAAKNQFEESAAAMILSKEFVKGNEDADSQLLHLKNLFPYANFDFKPEEARKILKKSKIQTTYSPEHAKILIKLASEFKLPEQKEKAIIYLNGALILEPNNKEVINKLKELQKE